MKKKERHRVKATADSAKSTPALTRSKKELTSDEYIAKLPKNMFMTSLRVVVPILGFSLAGVQADKRLGTSPTLSIASVIIASLISGYLVVKYVVKEFPEINPTKGKK